jgi:4-hydroxy-2-oxoglutarate aldolase
MPAELVIELANHPNIIGIKESTGDAEKIRRMVEGTRPVRRSATVTATFEAVTPRMLRPPAEENNGGALVTIGGDSASQPSAAAVKVPAGLKTREKQVGFQVLSGLAQHLKPSLEAGASGAVLAFASPAPTACYEIYAAWKEGDPALAQLKQDRITAASKRVGSELGIPGLKYAMDLNGYFGGHARLPLLPLTADLRAEVERLMADIRN